jgi:ribosomal protein L12E/L44/L45/RPP1/RPP2
MKQLSGVDLDTLLQNISRLPGAVADSLDSQEAKDS